MNKIATLAATAALALVGIIVTPTVAHALPENCTTLVTTEGVGRARCTGGYGYYRVSITCQGPWTLFYAFEQKGNWARVGGDYHSEVRCPLGTWNWKPKHQQWYYAFLEKRNSV